MKITLDRKSLVNSLLKPASRISEEASIRITPDKIDTFINNEDNSIFMYCSISTTNDIEGSVFLNIRDVRKLIRAMECVSDDLVVFNVDDERSILKYNSPSLKFRLHLVHPDVLRKGKISLEKVEALEYNTSFSIKGESLSQLLKVSSFSPDSNRVYFVQEDDAIMCEITNKNMSDMDSISQKVADSIKGDFLDEPLPMRLDFLRLINVGKDDIIEVKVNTNQGFFMFSHGNEEVRMLYLILAMAK